MNTTPKFLGIFDDPTETPAQPDPPAPAPGVDVDAIAKATTAAVMASVDQRAAAEKAEADKAAKAAEDARLAAEAAEAARKGDMSLELERMRLRQEESERETARLAEELRQSRLDQYRLSAISNARAAGHTLLEELVSGNSYEEIEASVHASISRYAALQAEWAKKAVAAAPVDKTPVATTAPGGVAAVNPGGTVPSAVAASAPPAEPELLSPEVLQQITNNPAEYLKQRDKIMAQLAQQSGHAVRTMSHPTFGTLPKSAHPTAFDPHASAAKPQTKSPADLAREAIARTRNALPFH